MQHPDFLFRSHRGDAARDGPTTAEPRRHEDYGWPLSSLTPLMESAHRPHFALQHPLQALPSRWPSGRHHTG